MIWRFFNIKIEILILSCVKTKTYALEKNGQLSWTASETRPEISFDALSLSTI